MIYLNSMKKPLLVFLSFISIFLLSHTVEAKEIGLHYYQGTYQEATTHAKQKKLPLLFLYAKETKTPLADAYNGSIKLSKFHNEHFIPYVLKNTKNLPESIQEKLIYCTEAVIFMTPEEDELLTISVTSTIPQMNYLYEIGTITSSFKNKKRKGKTVYFKGSYKEAKAKAKAENKLIFLSIYDFENKNYTALSTQISSSPYLSKFFNEHFINFKINTKDPNYKYVINSFSNSKEEGMFLFVDSKGSIFQSVVAYIDPEHFSSVHPQILFKTGFDYWNRFEREHTNGIEFFEGSIDEAIALSAKSGKPIFVEAYWENCPKCFYTDNYTLRYPYVSQLLNEHFINIKLIKDTPALEDFNSRFGLYGFPNFLFMNLNGQVMKHIRKGLEVNDVLLAANQALLNAKLPITHGIQFYDNTWQKGLKKAQEENKTVFVHLYSTQYNYYEDMQKHAFTNEDVGSIYNTNFINVKIDIDSPEGKEFLVTHQLKDDQGFLFMEGNGTITKSLLNVQSTFRYMIHMATLQTSD